MMKCFDSEYVGVADVVLTHSVFRKNVTCDNIKKAHKISATPSLENTVLEKQ